jgi:hypothetical protein
MLSPRSTRSSAAGDWKGSARVAAPWRPTPLDHVGRVGAPGLAVALGSAQSLLQAFQERDHAKWQGMVARVGEVDRRGPVQGLGDVEEQIVDLRYRGPGRADENPFEGGLDASAPGWLAKATTTRPAGCRTRTSAPISSPGST